MFGGGFNEANKVNQCVSSMEPRELTHKQSLIGCETDLGVVGLLDLLLVDADLFLMLSPQLAQGFGQLALKVQLPPAVDLHHAGLLAPLGLAQFLHTRIDGRECQIGDEKRPRSKFKLAPDYRRCNHEKSM